MKASFMSYDNQYLKFLDLNKTYSMIDQYKMHTKYYDCKKNLKKSENSKQTPNVQFIYFCINNTLLHNSCATLILLLQ